MKEITLPSGKYLMMEVPEDAKDFIIDAELFYKASFLGSLPNIGHTKPLPPGNWQIIGKADEMGEDKWFNIVEHHLYPFDNNIAGFENYNDEGYLSLITATQSGHSLLSSHGMKPETTLMLRLIPSGLAIDSTKVK